MTTEAGGQPQLSKAGAAFGNTTATLTAIGNGSYYVELTATELDTLGDIIVRYKSANTAEFNLHADVLPASAGDPWVTALPGAYGAGTAGNIVGNRLDVAVGTRSSQVSNDAIQADTDNLQTRVPTALVGGRMDSSVGAMAADVMTAAALAADFTVENNAPVLAVLGALANAASSGDPNTSNTIVQMLKQIVNTLEGTAGIPAWAAAAAPANAVSLAEAIRQIYTDVGLKATAAAVATVQADTDDIQTRLPAALVGGRIDANVGAWAGTVPATPAVAGRPVVDVTHWRGTLTPTNLAGVPQVDVGYWRSELPSVLQTGRVDASVGAMAANVMTGAAADPTLANEIADQVWDEVLSGHLTAGTTGAALNGAGGGATAPTAAAIADAVWDENALAHIASGSTGELQQATYNVVTALPTAIQNADALLGRNLASVAGAAARSPLNALRFLRNKWSVSAGTLTVTQEDDTTPAWTAAVTSDSSAAPVTGSDPA